MLSRRTVLARWAFASASASNRCVRSVWKFGSLLFGSRGGWPPFGEASVISTPASLNVKYGAANSSSQKPVLRPVLPSLSFEVRTIMNSSFHVEPVSLVVYGGQAQYRRISLRGGKQSLRQHRG